jgi:hypothetical protein
MLPREQQDGMPLFAHGSKSGQEVDINQVKKIPYSQFFDLWQM